MTTASASNNLTLLRDAAIAHYEVHYRTEDRLFSQSASFRFSDTLTAFISRRDTGYRVIIVHGQHCEVFDGFSFAEAHDFLATEAQIILAFDAVQPEC